jgi:hypothetical protein
VIRPLAFHCKIMEKNCGTITGLDMGLKYSQKLVAFFIDDSDSKREID